MRASNISETEGKIDVFIELYEILDGQEDCAQSINNNILSETSCRGNWNWVGVNGSVPSLIDWMLTLCWRNFLLSWISNQVVLQNWVHNKNWFKMMDIFSLHSLCPNIDLWADRSLSNFWKLSLDVESKSTKLLNIHTSSCSDVITEIFNQCLPDDNHLSFWLQWLQVWGCSLSWIVVLSWVLSTVFKDPIKDYGSMSVVTYQSIICSISIFYLELKL